MYLNDLTVFPFAHRFNDDIEWMTGRRPNIYWQATWRFISPFMLLVVFVAYIVIEAEKRPTYNAWNPDYVRKILQLLCNITEQNLFNLAHNEKKYIDFPLHYPRQVQFPLADVLHYPEWVYVICVLLSVLPVVSIPLVALYKFTGFLKKYIMNRHNQNPYANDFCQGDL